MKLLIDVDENLVCEGFERNFTEAEKDILIRAIGHGVPYKEKTQDEAVKEIIKELESRKDYGPEYAQAMEDAIVILKAMLGIY
jgi:hypothetical protein